MSLRRLLAPLRPVVRSIRSGKAAMPRLSVAVRSRWTAGLYCLFSGQWDREQRAVLHGRLAHIRGAAAGDDAPRRFALQRNTPRLEKSLMMRPRREVFAREITSWRRCGCVPGWPRRPLRECPNGTGRGSSARIKAVLRRGG